MMIWSTQLLRTVRQAVAGRKNPHQLAWAAAFGLLLGIVPHGNLLAVTLVMIVLSLNLNHAIAALTALTSSWLVAGQLDPWAHRLGDALLGHPRFQPLLMRAWELPLVPWSDLNNTVVMGSFLIGLFALGPVYLMTYPVFRWLSPAPLSPAPPTAAAGNVLPTESDSKPMIHEPPQLVMIDRRHQQVGPPHDRPVAATPVGTEPPRGATEPPGEPASTTPANGTEARVAVETRIDVIRMKDHRTAPGTTDESTDGATDGPPMDEALNYLLRQLRDSQQRSAA